MTAPTFDPVSKPEHYNAGPVECYDALRSMAGDRAFVDHLRCAAVEYIWRGPHKGAEVQDLRKAIACLARAASALEATP